MRLFARFLKSLPVLALCLVASGCVAAGAAAVAGGGAATYGYYRGTYRAILDAPLYQADQAIRSVARRGNLKEMKRECNGYRANYKFVDMSGVKVEVTYRAITSESTRIYIRVGTIGDRESSQILLDAIDRELHSGNLR